MLDYRLEELKVRQANTKQLRESINSGKIDKFLKEKIYNFCERHDIEFDLIKYKLMTDDLFVLNFIKEPSKQTFHQTLATEFMKKIPNVSNFQLLPAGGKDALYVVNGMVVPGSLIASSTVNVKSIDFHWIYTNSIGQKIECYASHKYTYQGGGSQDHQFKELITFQGHARQHQGDKYFYAICDGRYYLLPYETSLSKIDYLNKNFSGNRCCALDINHIENHMQSTL